MNYLQFGSSNADLESRAWSSSLYCFATWGRGEREMVRPESRAVLTRLMSALMHRACASIIKIMLLWPRFVFGPGSISIDQREGNIVEYDTP